MPQQRSTDHFELKPAQQRVLGVLKSEGTSRLTRARYEELSGVGRSQAAYDLAELVEKGILERLGRGRATRYRIVHPSSTAAGTAAPPLDAGAHPRGVGGILRRPRRVAFRDRVQADGALRSLRRRQPLRRDPVLDVGARSHARAATGAPRGEAAAQDVPATAAVGPRRCGRGAGPGARGRRAHPALARRRRRRGRATAAAGRELEAAGGPTARAARADRAAREASRSPGRARRLRNTRRRPSWPRCSRAHRARARRRRPSTPSGTSSSSPPPTSSSNPAPLPAPSGGDARHPLPPPPPGS